MRQLWHVSPKAIEETMTREPKRLLSRKNVIQFWKTLAVSTLVMTTAYFFNVLGLRVYVGDWVLPWILMTVFGAVAAWLFNVYSLDFTAWVLGSDH